MGVKPRLLVVEDEIHIRKVVAATLAAAGYEVDAAADGVEAWERLGPDHPPYDLVVTDLNMPNMDGFELLRRIQRLAPEQRPDSIVLTAFGRPIDHARAIELGARRVLSKPFQPQELRDVVKELVAATR